MDHLAKDLSVALEESESCGPAAFEPETKWRMRRRTRSAGNLYLYGNKAADYQTEESSSSPSEITGAADKSKKRLISFHQSDSDEMSHGFPVPRNYSNRTSFRMKHHVHAFLHGRYNKFGVNCGLESDSVNENSPARPSMRRKRKLKRMSVDEVTPLPQTGKRKRPQRHDASEGGKSMRHPRIKPLHHSVVEKIERYFSVPSSDVNSMEIQMSDQIDVDDSCEVASESSISWSGGEGHEGDDELTDWAPSVDSSSIMDQAQFNDNDPREIRAGCRRLRDERPGFSISTGANERVAKFLWDSTKSELRITNAEHEKLSKLAALYSLDIWYENPSSLMLRKTNKTPAMQPTQRHHNGLMAAHKRIRTNSHVIS